MKSDEFDSNDLKAIDKVIKVLKYLNLGQSITMRDREYKLAETITDGFSLVVLVSKESDEWYGTDISLDTFSSMCNELKDGDLFEMAANLALTKINQARGML